MPSNQASSPRSSVSSSPAPISTKSVKVFGVSVDFSLEFLLKDLQRQCSEIIKVTRFYDVDGNPTASIRVDFESEMALQTILDKDQIFVNGKSRSFKLYFPLICRRCNNEGHYQSDCPRQPITEEHLMQLLQNQQREIETMISDFDKRWDERLSSLIESGKLSSNETKMNEQLIPIFRDLSLVCQQFNQQNIQTQQQLNSVVQRFQQLQTTNNSQPIQNGHGKPAPLR